MAVVEETALALTVSRVEDAMAVPTLMMSLVDLALPTEDTIVIVAIAHQKPWSLLFEDYGAVMVVMETVLELMMKLVVAAKAVEVETAMELMMVSLVVRDEMAVPTRMMSLVDQKLEDQAVVVVVVVANNEDSLQKFAN